MLRLGVLTRRRRVGGSHALCGSYSDLQRKANFTTIHVKVKVRPIIFWDLRICQSEEDDSKGMTHAVMLLTCTRSVYPENRLADLPFTDCRPSRRSLFLLVGSALGIFHWSARWLSTAIGGHAGSGAGDAPLI